MLNRLPPSIAGSTWYGALMGAMVAVVLALLLSAAVSLTLGPTLDQGSSANALTNLNTSADIGQTGTTSVSLYSNPLMLFASANQSKLIEKITEDLSGDNSSPTSLQATASGTVSATTSPTLLLLIPAIGLIIGGYFAASTNYTGRRLFSITRGASICVIYAALVLIISLFATGSLALSASESGITLSINGTITPDPLSVFLNALLWGVLFGALGGFLRANAFPRTTHSRSYERIRSALIGTGAALGVYFVLCLLLIITLYVTGQLFTPTLLSQSGSTATGNLCASLSQSLNASTHTTSGSDAARYLFFIVGSPVMAFWLMGISMGAPLQISGAANLSIGLFGADCQLGSGALPYLLLLIPAAAFFLGGWIAARSVRPVTSQEAAGVGLLLAGALAILTTILMALASTTLNESISVNTSGLGTTVAATAVSQSLNYGPALGSIILAALIFGGSFGMLGSLSGRTRILPPVQPSMPSAWPPAPAGWPQAPQWPAQPHVSSAVANFPPASAAPGPAVSGNQPASANPVPPDAAPPSNTAGDAAGSADTIPPTT